MPEVESFQYLPYVKDPVLMLNGRYDDTQPLESGRRPYFEQLGSKDKELKLFEAGHLPPTDEIADAAIKCLKLMIFSGVNAASATIGLRTQRDGVAIILEHMHDTFILQRFNAVGARQIRTTLS